MSQGEILSIVRDADLTAPILTVTAVVGIAISIIQAATQIHEQSLSFILKIVAVGLIIVLLSSWGMTMMMDYIQRVFDTMSRLR